MEQLLREHEVIRDVLNVMDVESNRLLARVPLRFEVWSKIVEFHGDFVIPCHRVKEAELLVPLLVERGLLEQSSRMENEYEHARARRLTLGLIDGFEAGDWEKVHRISCLYTFLLREHMAHEDDWMRRLSLDDGDGAFLESVGAVNRSALGERGMEYYRRLALELCELADIAPGAAPR